MYYCVCDYLIVEISKVFCGVYAVKAFVFFGGINEKFNIRYYIVLLNGCFDYYRWSIGFFRYGVE